MDEKDVGVEQPGFACFECPECGFSSVQPAGFSGSTACPLCAGDSGHDVGMHRRVARSTDRPEGKDARYDEGEGRSGPGGGRGAGGVPPVAAGDAAVQGPAGVCAG